MGGGESSATRPIPASAAGQSHRVASGWRESATRGRPRRRAAMRWPGTAGIAGRLSQGLLAARGSGSGAPGCNPRDGSLSIQRMIRKVGTAFPTKLTIDKDVYGCTTTGGSIDDIRE